MQKISDEILPNYIDCLYFKSKSATFLIMTFVCQLLESLGFNGMFDIPAFFFMLVLGSIYSFRKSFYQMFGQLKLFSIQYIQVMIMIKIILMILLKIDMVENFMIDNTEHIFTKVIIVALGKRQASDDEDNTKFLLKRIGYNILMFSTYFFAQAWQ